MKKQNVFWPFLNSWIWALREFLLGNFWPNPAFRGVSESILPSILLFGMSQNPSCSKSWSLDPAFWVSWNLSKTPHHRPVGTSKNKPRPIKRFINTIDCKSDCLAILLVLHASFLLTTSYLALCSGASASEEQNDQTSEVSFELVSKTRSPGNLPYTCCHKVLQKGR